jgi:membrane-associated HD superfamily phosphohydrolase
MFALKRDAGQFDEAEITLHDMEVLKRELKSYLVQMYHERVVYPNKLPV